MDGIELACRFSYITNSLHYCGPSEAAPTFLRYIAHHDNADEVRASLKKFEGLYAYLKVIAQATGKDFLDRDVVESYWIGSSLLNKLQPEHLKQIIETLAQRGFPASMAQERINNLPSNIVAHHDFNVLFMGVGLTSGKVEPTLINMENCRVNFGTVVDFHGPNLIVQSPSLQYKEGKFSLSAPVTRTVTYLPQMLGAIKKGDVVAIHWGFAPLVLSASQLDNLKTYTARVRDAMNNSKTKPLGL